MLNAGRPAISHWFVHCGCRFTAQPVVLEVININPADSLLTSPRATRQPTHRILSPPPAATTNSHCLRRRSKSTMKFDTILCAAAIIAGHVRAVDTGALLKSARNAAAAGFQITKTAAEQAELPEHLAQAGRATAEHAGQAARWAARNPGAAAAYGLAGVGVVAVVAPAIIATPALGAAGFGAQGVAAGSLAAGVQGGIGNVIAGSAFATLQSAGAAGAGAAMVNGVVQAGGAGVALGSGGLAWLKSKAKL
ncbi:hypothetical protein BKA67DRAFT_274924 [Truncatella angustata]|uniref:Uncharacterized protein n=1 Tax=Truncatella angustata TaxID=152316 RepID=A0A9P8ZXN7_9PEZI|nr:uncharacterized protein BKA67DRAFT_274924 [Truncatella angustata]KAH6654318.1 hypothetical protein BKA67DRAFT_274924 [Truncatella angustata]